ncbi:MAG: UDP-N-acetylmuramate--L-alanine ligase [Anaerolineae bacterium]
MSSEQATADLSDIERVHIVGIGGAGMSAIARVLHGRGLRVRGSDRRSSPTTDALRSEGIGVVTGHAPENVGDADLVLASSAVPDDNVELRAARRRMIPVVRRSEFLPVLTAGYEVIAVAGAHGKTTVTGMIASLLSEAGLDPTYIVGGLVSSLETNGHSGGGRYFVIEADEYRSTFLALRPNIAVVTNVEFDHPDCFADVGAVQSAFDEFAANIVPGGLLVACGDDRIVRALAAERQAQGERVTLYGKRDAADLVWRAVDIRGNAQGGISFDVEHRGERLGEIALKIPGEFNAANALAALGVAAEVGIDWEISHRVLAGFEGTARRFEVLGDVDGITVIDDYAHHPTQIRGVLSAARQRYPGRRLVAAWEPHTFSRVRALYGEFMGSFGEADLLVVLPIYAAREPDDGTMTAAGLASEIAHPSVTSAATLDEAVALLAGIARPGDVVLLMGAGNEYIVGERLLSQLRRRTRGDGSV